MFKRPFLILCLFLLLAPLLPAEEVALTLAKSRTGPNFYFGIPPAMGKGPSWENGEKILTERAETLEFFMPFRTVESGERSLMLMSMDSVSAEAKHPDILFIDLNGNRAIDEDERFTLKQNDPPAGGFGSDYHELVAEKVPLPGHGDTEKEAFPVNIYCYLPSSDDGSDMGMIFSITAWGCLEGRAMLNGEPYRVTLYDQGANGSYADFEEKEAWQHDMISVVPDDRNDPASREEAMEPLRPKMIFAGSAYGVKLLKGGRRLALNPIQVEFGSVSPSRPNLSVTLFNAEWGSQSIEPGENARLPVGTWSVKDYRRLGKEQAICAYSGPPDMKVEITEGNSAGLDLDTALNAEVTGQRRGDMYNLSLKLTTSQGARFSGYYGGGTPLDGIPFEIEDASGTTVQTGKFTFG